jgi:hypothetical protein
MGKTKSAYPSIPRRNPEKAVDALTEASEILTGARGNGLDKAVTYRELFNVGLLNYSGVSSGQITGISLPTTNDPRAKVPPIPTNVTANGSWSGIIISWDDISFFGKAYAEIFRSATDDLGTASRVGSIANHDAYSDMVGTGESYYYWVRFVNINSVAGAFNATAGTFGETAEDVNFLLEVLTDKVTSSELADSLTSRIDLIDTTLINGKIGLTGALVDLQGQIDALDSSGDPVLAAQQYAADAEQSAIDASGYLTDAQTAASNAISTATSAQGYASDAQTAATDAVSTLTSVQGYASDAQSYVNDAAALVEAAQISETNAASSATAAVSAQVAADGSAIAALISKSGAETAETGAGQSALDSSTSATAAVVAQAAADGSASAALVSKTDAETAATGASTSATAAIAAKTAADGSASAALTSQTNAENAETGASTSATAAATSATNADGSAIAALTAQTNAESAESGAATSASAAVLASTDADGSAVAALASQTSATNSASGAATSATAATTAATNADGSASAALTAKTDAETAASGASTSAAAAVVARTAADGSAVAALTSQTNAESAESGANTSAAAAATSATDADGSASAALTAQTNAESAESGSLTNATAAIAAKTASDGSASAALASQTSATNSASGASTSASAAATSATNADGSASAALVSKTDAQNAASGANTSAIAAATSATNADGSASAALTAQTNAENAESGASTSATAAASSKTGADGSASSALSSKSAAANSATGANTSALASASSATEADGSASAALTASTNAANSASAAVTAKTSADGSASAALSSKNSAAGSATTATNKAAAAVTAATAADGSASAALLSKTDAEDAATGASTSAAAAVISKSDAAGSASSALLSKSASATSASAAAGSASTATTKAAAAVTSASEADGSAAAALASESVATTKAGQASTSASAAVTAKSAADGSAGAALTAKTNAETAEANALVHANTASNKAELVQQVNLSISELTLRTVSAFSGSYVGESVGGISSSNFTNTSDGIQITNGMSIYSKQTVAVDTSKKYELRAQFRVTKDAADTSKRRFYIGVVTLDKDFNFIGGGAGTHRYCTLSGQAKTVSNGIIDVTGYIEGVGITHNHFRAGTKYIRLLMLSHYSSGDGDTELLSLGFADVTRVGAVEDRSTVIETEQGKIKAERTIKVDSNGVVAGIGLIADEETGSGSVYVSADTFAILPSGSSNPADAGLLPFIVDNGITYIADARIIDLTANKIQGGNLTIDTLAVTSSGNNAITFPANSLHEGALRDEFLDTLLRIDLQADSTGGSRSINVSPIAAGLHYAAKNGINPLLSGAASTNIAFTVTATNGQGVVGASAPTAPSMTYSIRRKNLTSGATETLSTKTKTGSVEGRPSGNPSLTIWTIDLHFAESFAPPVGQNGVEYEYWVDITSKSGNWGDGGSGSLSVIETVSSTGGLVIEWNGVNSKPTTFPPTIGTGSTQAVAGNDSRLTNSRNANDVSTWAKASSLPTWNQNTTGNAATASKILSMSTTFNGKYPMVISENGNLHSHTSVTFEGSTGKLTAPEFVGDLVGNASSATELSAGQKTIRGDLYVGDSASSNIFMVDGGETTRRIHCNSNRIGFLTSSNGWGAYCDNSGNWFAHNLSGTNTGDETTARINALNVNASTLGNNSGSYYDHRAYTSANNYLGGHYTSGGSEKPNSSTFSAGKLKLAMLGGSNLGFGSTWNDVLWMSSYSGGDVKGSNAIVMSKTATEMYICRQNYDSASWGAGSRVWHSGNFNLSNSGVLSDNHTWTGSNTFTGSIIGNASSATTATTATRSVMANGLSRSDIAGEDSYRVRSHWQGIIPNHWALRGYNSGTYHAPVAVGYASNAQNAYTLDGLDSLDFARLDRSQAYDQLLPSKSSWLRAPNAGFLPSSNNNGSLGSSSWYFLTGYIASLYSTTVTAAGTVFGASHRINSSIDFKDIDHVVSPSESLDKICELGSLGVKVGVWNAENAHKDSDTHRWLIAEEVEKVFPELITYKERDGEQKCDSVNQTEIIADLCAAVHALREELKALKEQVNGN